MSMDEQHDDGLVALVSVGGWVRGTEVVSSWVAKNYTPEHARLLRQPALVAFLRSKINTLPPKVREDPLVQGVSSDLVGIEKLVSFPMEKTPSSDDVKAVRESATALVQRISGRKD